MFRRIGIGQRQRLVQRLGDHDAAAALQGGGDHLGAPQLLQLRQDRGLDLLGHGTAMGQQDGAGQHIMFGLGQQIGRGQFGIGALVGDDHRLGGAGQAVNADDAVDLAFGQRGEEVARTADLVDRLDALGAKGQRADGLGAAADVDGVDADDVGGHQDGGVGQAAARVAAAR